MSSRGCRTATSRRTTSSSSKHDPDSTLSLTRDLIGLRDALPELRRGDYTSLATPNGNVWAWRRGERTIVACNLSDAPVDIANVGPGTVRISSRREHDEKIVDDALHLEPWEAAIVWCDAVATTA